MTDLDDLQKRVGEWVMETLPRSTLTTIHAHLREEAQELDRALQDWLKRQSPIAEFVWPTVVNEVADVILLALHIAHRGGFSLAGVIEDKFCEVRCRTWEWDEKAGYYRHVEPTDPYEPEEARE